MWGEYHHPVGAAYAMEFGSGGSVTMAMRFPGHVAQRWSIRRRTATNGPSVADALVVYSTHRY